MPPETTTTTSDQDGGAATANDLRSRFDGFRSRAQAEWATAEAKALAELRSFPERLKSGATQAVDRLRSGLDLPTRGEVAALSARIEELAGKVARYESQGTAKARKVPQPRD